MDTALIEVVHRRRPTFRTSADDREIVRKFRRLDLRAEDDELAEPLDGRMARDLDRLTFDLDLAGDLPLADQLVDAGRRAHHCSFGTVSGVIDGSLMMNVGTGGLDVDRRLGRGGVRCLRVTRSRATARRSTASRSTATGPSATTA